MVPAAGPTAPWFVVLPDADDAWAVRAALGDGSRLLAEHPSGRPWVLGRVPAGQLVTARAGDTALLLAGQHGLGPERLAAAAAAVRSIADLDRLAGSLPGSWHLVASVGGKVRVQGTVTGIRRVFTATVAGTAVAADRADVLAALLGARLDERRLALHLLHPHLLHPLAGLPVWRGVDVLRRRLLRAAGGRPGPHGALVERRPSRSCRWPRGRPGCGRR